MARTSTLLSGCRDRIALAMAVLWASTILLAPAVVDGQHGLAVALVALLVASTGLVVCGLTAAPASVRTHPTAPGSDSPPHPASGLVTDIPRSPLRPRAPGAR